MTGTEIAPPAETQEILGPLMRACTEKQQAFVIALVTSNDPSNETAAARAAGYAAPAVSASGLMRSRKVLAAIREEADKRLGASALIGTKALIEIASDPTHKQRLQAGIKLLEYAGLQVIAKQEIVVKDDRVQSMTVDQLMHELRESAKRLGLVKPEDFAQNAVEGEFVEVADFDFVIEPGEYVDEAGHLRGTDEPAGEARRDGVAASGPGVQLDRGERHDGGGD